MLKTPPCQSNFYKLKMNDYYHATTILDEIKLKKKSVKALCLSQKVRNKKKMYALVSETLRNIKAIDSILERTQILKHEPKLNRSLAELLIYDFCISKREIAPGWMRNTIRRHRESINTASNSISFDSAPPLLPRYARVNTLLCTTQEAIDHFTSLGWILNGTEEKNFVLDEHVPDVLRFPPTTDLHDDNFYLNGKIILQDKASCFPAFALDPPLKGRVIDCCAAPGNKSTHLSALMQNKGKISAYECNKDRFQVLQKMINKAGCKNIKPIHCDFFTASMPQATHALVDPSCSGNALENEEVSINRLRSLSSFQCKILCKVLEIPTIQRVVYSTCSTRIQENELVIARALKQHKDFQIQNILPSWSTRGTPCKFMNLKKAKKLVRSFPESGTKGFFVACLQRTSKWQRLAQSRAENKLSKHKLRQSTLLRKKLKKLC